MIPEPDHYFDYAAACPVRPEIAALYPEYCRRYAVNPHATTCFAHDCQRAIEASAARLLAFLGLSDREAEVIWCASATEALNLAIRGWRPVRPARLACDPTAHAAMLAAARRRADEDLAPLAWLSAGTDGRLSLPENFRGGPETLLAICHTNNETGVRQSLGFLRERADGAAICLDASQSLGRTAIPWHDPDIAAIALSARKIGGPPGLGMLVRRKDFRLNPLIVGGGQQHGLRAGTLDTVAIALLAPTLDLLAREQENETRRLAGLNRRIREKILLTDENWRILSPPDAVPAILCIAVPGRDGAVLARLLAHDYGFQISSGSACQAESPEPSHVLTAMGYDAPTARAAIRISLGHDSTEAGADALIKALARVSRDY